MSEKSNNDEEEDSDNYGITKLIIPTKCCLDYQTLHFPVRGKYCDHINCFSLKTFLGLYER